MVPIARLLLAIFASALLCAAQGQKIQNSVSQEIRKAIESANREIDAAQERRDRAAADRRLADPFILIHAGGAFDSRTVFLNRVGNGTVRGESDDVAEFDVSIEAYGEHTAIRRSRVRRRATEQKREGWILETKVFVKQNGHWLLASVQDSRLYTGPIIDVGKYDRLVGEYVSDSGRKLTLVSAGYGFFVHWPLGTSSQVFPVSDTDVADELRRLHFTLDSAGKPVAAAEFRHRPLPPPVYGTEGTWRGRRIK